MMSWHAWFLVKTLFSQKIFVTSIGELKLKFEYHQQLKEIPFPKSILSRTSQYFIKNTFNRRL